MAMPSLTAERLRQLFNYNPSTGVFTRLTRTNSRGLVGAIAGANCNGYVTIGIDGKRYYGHRLAWFYVHGEWPPEDVDHIDGNRANNQLENLRAVDRSANLENQRAAKSHSSTGFLGIVRRSETRWIAAIRVKGVGKHLGSFKSPEAAHEAYLNAKRKLHQFNTL